MTKRPIRLMKAAVVALSLSLTLTSFSIYAQDVPESNSASVQTEQASEKESASDSAEQKSEPVVSEKDDSSSNEVTYQKEETNSDNESSSEDAGSEDSTSEEKSSEEKANEEKSNEEKSNEETEEETNDQNSSEDETPSETPSEKVSEKPEAEEAVIEDITEKSLKEAPSATPEKAVNATTVVTNNNPKSETPITSKYEAQNKVSYSYKESEDGDAIDVSSVAFDFHIFAKEVTLKAHTNGNVACDTLNGNGQGMGTNQNNDSETTYIGTSASQVGNIAHGTVVVGSTVDTKLEDNNNRVSIGTGSNAQNHDISKSTYKLSEDSGSYIDIDKELEKMSNLSAQLAKQPDSSDSVVTVTKPSDFNQKITIKVDSSDSKVAYTTLDASTLLGGGSKREILISGTENTTLVINVDMTNATSNSLKNITSQIEGYSTTEQVYGNTCNVIWNLYQTNEDGTVTTYTTDASTYTSVGGDSDYFMGAVLAPGTNVSYGALNGTLITQKAVNTGKESHNWTFTGLEKEEPTPSEAPSEAPSETPSEAPSETPSEEVSEAPSEEPSEEVSEAPSEEPSEEVSEAPSEEPSEEVSEAPSETPSEDVMPPEEPSEAPSETTSEEPSVTPSEDVMPPESSETPSETPSESPEEDTEEETTEEESTKPTAKKSEKKSSTSPKTGDSTNVLEYFSLALASLLGILLILKKSFRKEDK